MYNLIKIERIKCITFCDLLAKYGLSQIDYLSVDTEGSEFAILNSIPFDSYSPICISVENNYGDSRISDLMFKNNYSLVANLGCDEIYHK